jgi:C4-dicarboxylate transporter
MIWLILALLLIISLVGLLGSYTLIGGVIQIVLICALVAMVIHRIRRFNID